MLTDTGAGKIVSLYHPVSINSGGILKRSKPHTEPFFKCFSVLEYYYFQNRFNTMVFNVSVSPSYQIM